ncbi:unnamed protein product [Peniophora sp. CBMAI 1063]|nr:unnamed protein product [Peniophora sp. CBMAI 1063]
MDKSLDDIVMQNQRPKGGRRGSARRSLTGRNQILGNTQPAAAPATRARIANNNAPPTGPAVKTPSAEKIMVSNLPQDVSEAQIKELFDQTVGTCKEVNLHHDAQGRSKGVAFVRFARRGDGRKAYEQYNNRLIDGKRAMRIEVIIDPTAIQPAAPSLAARVAPAPAPAEAAAPANNGARRNGSGPRGRGRGGRGGRRPERVKKTAEDLDAEMEDYTGNNASAAAAPATAPAAAAAT